MSAEYKNVDLNKIAHDAERDLNTDAAKKGHAAGPTSTSSLLLTFIHLPPSSTVPPTSTSPYPLPSIHPPPPKSSNPNIPPASDTGIDEAVTTKFPGSTLEYGTGASNNRTIPESEGGSINPATGKLYKAGDYAHGGVGAPEQHKQGYARNQGGKDDVRGNMVGGASLRTTGAKQ